MIENKSPSKSGMKWPRWAWIALALAVVAGLVFGASAIYSNTRKEAAAPITAPPAAVGGTDGCIAGRENDAATLVDGARQQPHTSEGAAATAAGFLRFAGQYPWSSEQELVTVLSNMYDLAPGENYQEIATSYHSISAPETARTVGLSVADGRYVIEPTSTQDKVQVSIASQVIIDGRAQGVLATRLTMAWGEGIWKIVDSEKIADAQGILDTGAAFVGGC